MTPDPRPWDPPEYWDPPEDEAPALCWHILTSTTEDFAHSSWELTEIVSSLVEARLSFTAELTLAD